MKKQRQDTECRSKPHWYPATRNSEDLVWFQSSCTNICDERVFLSYLNCPSSVLFHSTPFSEVIDINVSDTQTKGKELEIWSLYVCFKMLAVPADLSQWKWKLRETYETHTYSTFSDWTNCFFLCFVSLSTGSAMASIKCHWKAIPHLNYVDLSCLRGSLADIFHWFWLFFVVS